MAGRRITVVADFEMLIARASFTKESLARAAKVNRGVINPNADGVGGTLRSVTAMGDRASLRRARRSGSRARLCAALCRSG
jgi:hypothetical protein